MRNRSDHGCSLNCVNVSHNESLSCYFYTYVDVVKQKLKSKKKGNYSKMVKTTTVIFSRAR